MTPRKPSRARDRRAPGQLGSVQQLPSGRWRAFYRVEGERFTAPDTFPTKAEAQAWIATERADRARGIWRDPRAARVTVADYAREWLDARTTISPRTRQIYTDMIDRYIVPPHRSTSGRVVELGAAHLVEVTPQLVRTWHGAVLETARASASERLSRKASKAQHPARAWAQHAGVSVEPTGALPRRVLEAWRAAGSPKIAPPRIAAPENAGRSTAAHAYNVLHAIMATAADDELIPANPCRIRGAGADRAAERRPATAAEVDAIAALMPERLRAAVIVAAWSGLRLGELFALDRSRVDLTAGTLRVDRTLIELSGTPLHFGPTKTPSSRRPVHLPRAVVAVLAEHMEQFTGRSPDALVFTTSTGAPWPRANVSHAFIKARAKAGRPDLRWHDLRHTAATLAYLAGGSVPEVQRRLGHATQRMAARYAHVLDNADALLAARLDALAAGESDAAPRLRAV